MSTTTTTTATYSSFYSDEYKYAAAAYSITAVTVGIILGFLGKFHLMFNLIDALAIIYFLFLMNVNQPTNVLDFQKMFGKFHYDFMYDYLEPSIHSDVTSTAPLKFKMNGFDSFFLDNASLSLCIIIGLLGVYIILKLVSFIPMGRVQFFLKESLKKAWEFDYFIYILWLFYNQFTVFSFLQKESMTFDSNIQIGNFIVFLVIAIILVVSPFFFAYLVQSRKYELALPANQRSSQIRYLSLVSGYKINIEEDDEQQYNNPNNQNQQDNLTNINKDPITDRKELALSIKSNEDNQETDVFLNPEEQKLYTPFGKYMVTFILIRKLLFGGILVLLQEYKVLCLSVFSGTNLILFLLYVFSRPHILKIDNIRNAITEACFVGLYAIIYFFDDFSSTVSYNEDDTQTKLGWLYISICILVLAIHLIDVIAKLVLEIIKIYRKNKQPSNKIAPLPIQNKINDPIQESPAPIAQQQQLQQPQVQQEPIKINKLESPPKNNTPQTLQYIQMNNFDKKSDITAIDKKGVEPIKTTKTSFNEFIQSDVNILSHNEDKVQFKKRIRPLLFKRNPYIPKDGYYDDIIHNSDKKNNQTKTTLGLGTASAMPTNINFNQVPTDVNIQNY